MYQAKNKLKLFKVYNPPKLGAIFNKILKSGYIAEGEYVTKFKKKLGIFLNNPNVVLFNSCTSALTAAYQVAGIKKNSKLSQHHLHAWLQILLYYIWEQK